MSSNNQQQQQQTNYVPSLSHTVVRPTPNNIPEDIIKEYLLPYMVHLTQIDTVIHQIQTRSEPISHHLLQCAKLGETSSIRYIHSHYPLSDEVMNKALMRSCEFGRFQSVKYLCNLRTNEDNDEVRGAYMCDLNYREPSVFGESFSAMSKAIQNGHLDIVKYICQLKNDDNDNDESESISYYRANLSGCDNIDLRLAVASGYFQIVKYLCELRNSNETIIDASCSSFRCDPSDDNDGAMILATSFPDLEIFKYLCQLRNDDGTFRCDPFNNDNYILDMARRNGLEDIVNYLSGLKNDDGTYRCSSMRSI